MGETNADRVRRFVELVKNQQRLELLGDFFHHDYVEHDPVIAAAGPGLSGYRRFLEQANASLPDNHITLELLVAEEDRVVFIGTLTATHRGPFLGVPATGKQARWSEVQGFRFEAGKVKEHWVYADVFGLLVQLGVIAQPSQPAATKEK